jgi:uncharacterized protein (TIRG00374 family)
MASLHSKLRILLLFFSLAILAMLLYVSDVTRVFAIISGANPYYVFPALLISFSLMPVRVFRWKVLLEKIRIHVPFRKLFPTYMAGMFVSNLTPGKVGEPIKSYLLKKTAGVSISKSLPSVFMEKIFDVFSTVTLSFMGIALVTLPEKVGTIILPIIFLYVFAVTAALYVSARKDRIYFISRKMLRLFGWLPFVRRLDKPLESFAEKFNASLLRYKDARVSLKNFMLSMFLWAAEGVILYLCFLAVGIEIDALVVISFFSIAVLIGVTSLLPGGLGSSEVVMVLLFTATYALPIPVVTAAVFMARFFSFWVNVITGALCMGSLKLRLG